MWWIVSWDQKVVYLKIESHSGLTWDLGPPRPPGCSSFPSHCRGSMLKGKMTSSVVRFHGWFFYAIIIRRKKRRPMSDSLFSSLLRFPSLRLDSLSTTQTSHSTTPVPHKELSRASGLWSSTTRDNTKVSTTPRVGSRVPLGKGKSVL